MNDDGPDDDEVERRDDSRQQPFALSDDVFRQLQEAVRPFTENLAARITQVMTPVIDSKIIPRVSTHLDDLIGKIELPSITVELPALAEAFRRLRDAYIPTNLIPLDFEDMLRLPAIAEEQRVAILWTPRTEVLEELLAAESAEQRSAIVDRRKEDIVEDCRGALSVCDVEWAADLVKLLERAIDSFQGGSCEAAQALATCVLDTSVYQYLGEDKFFANLKDMARTTGEDEQFWRWLTAASVSGLPKAFYRYRYGNSEPRFNRNSTVHCAGDLGVFTDVNAARAISLATGVLRFFKSHETHYME